MPTEFRRYPPGRWPCYWPIWESPKRTAGLTTPTTIRSPSPTFKTFKYRPEVPDRFGCIYDAREFCQRFFSWYNTEHHHSGLGWLTPQVVHGGQSAAVLAARQKVLNQAFRTTPERFVRKPPQSPRLLDKVWINPPDPREPERRTASLNSPR